MAAAKAVLRVAPVAVAAMVAPVVVVGRPRVAAHRAEARRIGVDRARPALKRTKRLRPAQHFAHGVRRSRPQASVPLKGANQEVVPFRRARRVSKEIGHVRPARPETVPSAKGARGIARLATDPSARGAREAVLQETVLQETDPSARGVKATGPLVRVLRVTKPLEIAKIVVARLIVVAAAQPAPLRAPRPKPALEIASPK
jgi:hypothetical protein